MRLTWKNKVNVDDIRCSYIAATSNLVLSVEPLSTVAYQFTVEDRFLACNGKLGSCSHLPEAETIRRSFSSMSGAFAFNYDNNDDDYRYVWA